MSKKKSEIRSLNETPLAGISIDELEARLKMEDTSRVEMWGCSCNAYNPNCGPSGLCVYEPGCWPWCQYYP